MPARLAGSLPSTRSQGEVMLSLRLLTLTLCTLFLAACARSPVVQLYDGPAKADSQVLTVKVPVSYTHLTLPTKA